LFAANGFQSQYKMCHWVMLNKTW